MSTSARIRIAVQTEDFDTAAETARLTNGLADIGAIVTFVGVCRSEGGRLAALELEHYPGMAEAEISRIAEEAAARWPLQALAVIHRTVRIEPGENIVLAIAVSSHREAAFAAAEYVMDFLKTAAPIWKKEHTADGTARHWVKAKTSDDEAAARWHGQQDRARRR